MDTHANFYQLPDGTILNLPEHVTDDRERFQLRNRTIVSAVKVRGLLAPPRALFGRCSYVERWVKKGPEGDRRVRQLRAAGITATTRTVRDSRKLWNEPGADRVSVDCTEITYVLPSRLFAPPAIVVPQPAAA
jgi:hypothetical protein